MKARYLFPPVFRILGILMAIPGFILGYFVVFRDYAIPGFELHLRTRGYLDRAAFENFTNELALTLVVGGLLFIAFSKVKREDELTARIRLNALYWAILTNYLLYAAWLLLALLNEAFKVEFLEVLTNKGFQFSLDNFFLPLAIFIARFYYLLYKSKNEYQDIPLHFLPNKPYNVAGKLLSIALLLPSLYGMLDLFRGDYFEYLFYFMPFVFLLWIYSKERVEDEYINSIRLSAMQIAVYVNYAILLLANIFCYGIEFLLVQEINLITIPLIFVIVFQYRLYRLSKETSRKSGQLNMNIL
ncbi:hypothetical protein GCM10023149_47830 [Mucilaginibacter gynuensis]|uniref:Uncharacterized protein n=1 Tax=Mucilaginibacter gynuensis TaxID=1302236 RepID=A0ABP8HE11_9SPHI